MKFTRRDAIRTGAGAAAGLLGTRLIGSRAYAQELKYTPEAGATLRLLRWAPFVQADEDQWLANTKRFTEATGVEVRVDNMYRPKAHLPGKKKPSQHSYGLAIDLTRLKLSDGTELIVERDFDGAIGEPVCGKEAREGLGKEAGKLRDLICDIARAELFHHILTPNHDAAHRDHFHLDIARNARQRIIE